jgi:hypothetical protein
MGVKQKEGESVSRALGTSVWDAAYANSLIAYSPV